jgi:hypothetical protein
MIEGPKPGDVVPMRTFTIVQPNLSVSYGQKDKKTVAVFMLLGHQLKDGSANLDCFNALHELGWQPSALASKAAVEAVSNLMKGWGQGCVLDESSRKDILECIKKALEKKVKPPGVE